MKKLSDKSKKILCCVLCLVIAVAAVSGIIYYRNTKTEYDSSTKNAIAMGTVITAKTYGEYTALSNEEIISAIQKLDDVISWRSDSSVVSALNRDGKVNFSQLTDVVNLCNKVSKDSSGAFDITVGNVSNLWGFGTDNERIPEKSEIEKALKTVDYKMLKVNGTEISCADGQFIDLGSVGKGYACDMIYQYLKASDLKGGVVSVGGSIVACGNRNKAGDKWRIAIKHPRKEQAFLGTIEISEGFVSTSGDYERYFEKDAIRYHHLLDARTGYPANSGLVSVTIVSDNGLLSDALSTACFVLGLEEGTKLAEKYGVSAIFVDSEERITVVGDVSFKEAQTW